MKEVSESEMLRKMADYCSVAERCVSEVEKKIKAAGLDSEASERIVSRLIKEKFIDEARYARFFVRDKFRFNKWGRIKINFELQQKGISSAVRNEAIADNISEEDYADTLRDLLKSKTKTVKGKNDYDIRMKLFRFAAGRGFESGAISKALSRITGQDLDDYEQNDENEYL